MKYQVMPNCDSVKAPSGGGGGTVSMLRPSRVFFSEESVSKYPHDNAALIVNSSMNSNADLRMDISRGENPLQ